MGISLLCAGLVHLYEKGPPHRTHLSRDASAFRRPYRAKTSGGIRSKMSGASARPRRTAANRRTAKTSAAEAEPLIAELGRRYGADEKTNLTFYIKQKFPRALPPGGIRYISSEPDGAFLAGANGQLTV